MSTGKMIVLRSSDNETFEVEEAVAVESQTIKHMIEDDCADTSIPLPNVTSKILAKVIEYCKKHVETPKSEDKANEEELKSFDADFVKVDQGTLFDLILVKFLKPRFRLFFYIIILFVDLVFMRYLLCFAICESVWIFCVD